MWIVCVTRLLVHLDKEVILIHNDENDTAWGLHSYLTRSDSQSSQWIARTER